MGDGLGTSVKAPRFCETASCLFHSLAEIIFARMVKPRKFCQVTGHRGHTLSSQESCVAKVKPSLRPCCLKKDTGW